MSKLALPTVLAAIVGALTLGAIASAAGGPTRSEYVGRLEAICKPRAEATARTMEGVRTDVRKRRYGVAAGKFDAAGRIFRATVGAISAVPRPSDDAATLTKWFSHLRRQQRYLQEISAELRAGEAIKAQHLTAAFIHSGNQANDVVLAYGFDYCRFKFSRFS
jgi:hypothetical protein